MKFTNALWSLALLVPICLISTLLAPPTKSDIQAAVSKDKAPAAQAPMTKDKIFMGLVSNHTRVFAKDDLFKERFDPKELQIWYRYLNEVKAYAAANDKGDQKLENALNAILEKNDALINTLKMTYHSLFAPGGGSQETVITSSVQKFQQVSDAMSALQKSLARETYLYKSKKEVRDVLEQLALFIELTASKARTDLRKKVA